MKKKIILFIIPIIVLALCIFNSNLFAFSGLASWIEPSGEGIVKIDNTVLKIWKTITRVIQIASFVGIVFTGIRYMFASADQKADMKSSMGKLLIGLILVFGAATVVSIVQKIVSEAL